MASEKISTLYPYYISARARIAQLWEEYYANAEECASQGYRPSHCVHGVYLWVDYDCVCWRCEESLTDLEWAVALAHKWARADGVI
jgi:hypothetical protein